MEMLDMADRLARAVEAHARTAGITVTTCVVDAHGNLVLLRRMDDAVLISVEMAQRKAYTAAALRMETEAITPLDQPGAALHTLSSVSGGRYVALGGGFPVWHEGRCIAGLGVSGSTTENDIALARSALAALSDT